MANEFKETNFGGGYGSTGVTISDDGNIQANGTATIDSGVTVGTNTEVGTVAVINGAASSNRRLRYQTAGVTRWEETLDTNEDFRIARYNSSGVFQDNPFLIDESNGDVTFANLVNFASGDNYGTWTPTLTAVANVSSSAATSSSWIRMGDKVLCFLEVGVTPSGATDTRIRISLPISSNLASSRDCCGSMSRYINTDGPTAAIKADTTNDDAELRFVAQGTGLHTFNGMFGYTII